MEENFRDLDATKARAARLGFLASFSKPTADPGFVFEGKSVNIWRLRHGVADGGPREGKFLIDTYDSSE